MNVSVIIPTLNASSTLEKLLIALSIQEKTPCEVIVIDSSSKDNTLDIAKACGAKTVIIERGKFDHGGTRNIAVEEAKGDVLVFMTQDALPLNEKFIGNLIAPLGTGGIAASYGRHMPHPDARPTEKFARLFNYPAQPAVKGRDDIEKLGIKTFFMSNVCSSLLRKEFMEVGGFPEKTPMNEDMLISAKLISRGYKVAYAPDAPVIHSHNYSLLATMRRYFDIGVSLGENDWVLKMAKAEPEGRRFLTGGVSFLVKNRHIGWIPYLFAESFMKYTGYRFGLGYKKLPGWLVRSLSMHKFPFP